MNLNFQKVVLSNDPNMDSARNEMKNNNWVSCCSVLLIQNWNE